MLKENILKSPPYLKYLATISAHLCCQHQEIDKFRHGLPFFASQTMHTCFSFIPTWLPFYEEWSRDNLRGTMRILLVYYISLRFITGYML